jgi:hypothetical protein
MKRILAVLALAFSAFAGAQEFTPVEGHYWNENESGTGYNVQMMNGTMVVTIYSYTVTGAAQWYLVVCRVREDLTCSGALTKFEGGQSIGGSYVAPLIVGEDGTATFKWIDEATIEVLLPQGRVTIVRPLEFKRYAGASALLGKWVFIAFNPNGTTRSTPVLAFTEVNEDNDLVFAPEQNAECRALLLGLFGCKILDIDNLPSAVWIVRLLANSARGASGNTLDGDVTVHGYRLDPATDALPPEPPVVAPL